MKKPHLKQKRTGKTPNREKFPKNWNQIKLMSGMRSTGTSIDIFVRGVLVGFTHTEKLLIKKLKIAGETGGLEAESGEDSKKPDIGNVVESYFNCQMNTQVA